MTSLNEGTLTNALVLAQQQLQNFAQSENFWTTFDSVFGTEYDRTQAEAIQQAWQASDFSQLPEIQVLDSASMPGIQGGFSAQTSKIYINADFLANATVNQIAAVLIEEIGHSLDSQINTSDTPGDEGELFSAFVTGQPLTNTALERIHADNDQRTITVNDITVDVESASDNYGFLGKQVEYQYVFPDFGSNYTFYPDFPNVKFIVVEPPEITGTGYYSVDVDANQITVNYLTGVWWTGSSFNGFRITDFSGAVSPITGVTDNSPKVTTTFDSNNIYINWQGASFTTGETFVVNVNFGNEAPSGSNKTLTTNEDTAYTFVVPDFGFSDIDGDAFNRVRFTTIPTAGSLTLNGSAVSAGTFVNVNDIIAGNLKFTPAPNSNGNSYTSFTFQVEDNGSTASEGANLDPTPNTITVNVAPINDPPVIDLNGADAGTGFATIFTEDAGAVSIVSPNLSLIDVDSAQVNSAVIRITNLLNAGSEFLSVNTAGTSITTTYYDNVGILELRGFDSVANYQQVLRSLTYNNTSQNPTYGDRSIQFSINDSMANSNQAFSTVTVIPMNDAPVIDLNGADTGTEFAATFTEDAGAVNIVGSNLTLIDVDSAQVNIASVRILNPLDGLAEKLIADATGTNITVTYFPSTFISVLELRGWDTAANYQKVLRTVQYNNTSQNPTGGDRSVQFSVNDSMANSNQAFATITVTPVNDAPTGTATASLAAGTEDITYTINKTDLLAGFSDVDGNFLSVNNFIANEVALTADSNGNYVFTPPPNFNGSVTLNYNVVDGKGGSVTATQSFSIAAANDAPVIANAITTQNGTEDTAILFTIPANTFSDVDDASLSLSATLDDGSTLPDWLRFNATTRTFNGTPPQDFNGTLSLKVTATDSGNLSTSSTFDLAIAPVNDAPIVSNAIANQAATEDSAFSFMIPENTFSDVDGDDLIYSVSLENGNPLPSWLTFDAITKTFSGTPENGDVETISVLVTASDGQVSVSNEFELAIANTNDAPTLTGTSATLIHGTEDTTYTISAVDLLQGFSDVDTGDVLSVVDLSATNGNLVNNNDGTYSFTPDANFNGTVNLAYNVVDSNGGSITATHSFTVDAVNDIPTGTASAVLVNETEDTAYTVTAADLLQGFSDVDGDILAVSDLTTTNGNLANKNDGTYILTPTANFNGAISFTYNVIDGNGGSIAATQSITIAPVNDAPSVSNAIAAQTTLEDNLFTFTIPTDTFSDVDGDALTYTATLESGKALPTWLSFDGTTFSGTPTNDQVGNLSIKVTATDGQLAVSNVFNLAIANTNDAPTASNDSLSTNEDAPLVISTANLLGNDVDVDLGDILSISAITQPNHGGLVANNNGTYTYTPSINYNGVDSFTYTMRDRDGATSTATVNLTINAVNDNPDAINDIITARQGTAKTILATDLLANDADIEGNTLRLTQVRNAQNGTVALDSNGNVVFTANANIKTASFEYTLSDGQGGLDTATVNVLVGMTDDGGNGQDTMNGTAGDDVLNGGNDDDTLFGFGGDDMLLGGNGMDKLQGGEGKDWLYGGRGNDLLNGGLGSDTFVLIAQNGTDTIQDFTDGVDRIGLAEGLTLGQLTVSASNGNTLIAKNNGEVLAILTGVNSNLITQADFITVA